MKLLIIYLTQRRNTPKGLKFCGSFYNLKDQKDRIILSPSLNPSHRGREVVTHVRVARHLSLDGLRGLSRAGTSGGGNMK